LTSCGYRVENSRMKIPSAPRPVSTDSPHSGLPYLALTGAVFLWAGSFIAMRVAVAALPPGLVVWLRMAVTILLLLPFYRLFRPTGYRKGDLRLLIPMVLFQPCLYFLFESQALVYTTSSQAGVISSTVPVLVALGALLFLGEPMNGRQWTGLVLSVAGVAGLTLAGAASPDSKALNPLLGNSLEFLAMLTAAGNILLVKHLAGRYNTWTLTAWQSLAGFIFFLPAIARLPAVPPGAFSPTVVASILFLGLLVNFGAFGLYNFGLGKVPAARASIFINLIPVLTAILGWSVLGERLTPPQLLFAGLVVLAVRIGSGGKRLPRPAAA
jgi:drug/metabolite transporter (DMT)-like permease